MITASAIGRSTSVVNIGRMLSAVPHCVRALGSDGRHHHRVAVPLCARRRRAAWRPRVGHGAPADRVLRRDADADLRVRADRAQPGPEHDRDRAQPTSSPTCPATSRASNPGLVYAEDGTTPRVDVVHLHHGVWLINGYPTFAAGEEKTTVTLPQGYGFRHEPSEPWLMNHMVHNLRPDPASVMITYEIDFVPDTAAAAADITRRQAAVDGRRGPQAVPGLRRAARHRPRRALHLPRRRQTVAARRRRLRAEVDAPRAT